jgi:hypothetical protein
MRYDDLGLEVPRILLPADDVPLETWAVIACDQHTSDPGYWEQVARTVGDAPSSLPLIFPEVYLEAPDRSQRIESIRATMLDYDERGVLRELPPGLVLVDRETAHVPSRKGLVVALDLECYSYAEDARTLIRTTEGTVVSRLAPRIEVRRDAPLELPHILVLIDDPQRTVIEPLFNAGLPCLYDVPLMHGGGRVRGWQVAGDHVESVAAALRALRPDGADAMLYAMGDGNHSFATAQAVWHEIRDAAGGLAAVADHPARHALVELVNLHDDGLVFEPIHRAVFGASLDRLVEALSAAHTPGAVRLEESTGEAWEAARREPSSPACHRLPVVDGARRGVICVDEPPAALPAATLQDFLTTFEEGNAEVQVDYIHGEEEAIRLGGQPDTVGILAEVIDKHDLFPTIARSGPLPRKSFSLGEAEEKRYYLEARRIRP